MVVTVLDDQLSRVRARIQSVIKKDTYSGRAIAYGYVNCDSPGHIRVTTSSGKPVLRDSTMIQGQHDRS